MNLDDHKLLVARAAKWLGNSTCSREDDQGVLHRRPISCSIILTEPQCGFEIPDAIGWAFCSVMVECKVTRSDFKRDQKKVSRQPGREKFGMGNFRYYLTPPGLLKTEELPARWGLIECLPKTIRMMKLAASLESDQRKELAAMAWGFRKLQNGSQDPKTFVDIT